MIDRFRKVDNPLTIIAIFAGITEVAASAALPFLSDATQQVFVWFLFLFPFALVAAFFATLNFNPRVLYAPGDYKDEKHFLEALSLSQDRPQVTVTSADETPSNIQEPVPSSGSTAAMSNLEGLTQAELDAVNAMFHVFNDKAREFFDSQLITGYSFGFQGEGLFLLTMMLHEAKGPNIESRILRASTSPSNGVELRLVGRKLMSSSPEQFANLLSTDLRETILHRLKMERKREQAEPNN